MIDHFTLPVSNLEKSKAFYLGALAPLGLSLKADYSPEACGFASEAEMAGIPGEHGIGFWIVTSPKKIVIPSGQHLAFRAPSRLAVDAFHMIGLSSGGTDNGPPGVREKYHPSYYAAFVIDPDGHKLEAVYHG